MNNSNLIARLYPWPPDDKNTAAVIKNSRFAVLPLSSSAFIDPFGRLDGCGVGAGANEIHAPYLKISFDRPPRTSHGLIFGTDIGSDVLLSGDNDLSAYHFSICFDEQQRLVIRDLNSGRGTRVKFGNLGGGFRRRFQWLVGCGDKIGKSPVVITVNSLSFCLVPQWHDVTDVEYLRKAQYFSQGLGNDPELFNSVNLILHSELEQPPGANPFLRQPMYLEKPLARGFFGLVSYRCNVNSGEEVVVKRPLSGLGKADVWKSEAHHMRALEHENILRLLHAEFSPNIELILEYCPHGSILNIANEVRVDEILSILQQSLAGLQHAHFQGIAHRDLKHDNILIARRRPLHIKLADFGLAKGSGALQTYCGTPNFMAPELLIMPQVLKLANPIPGKVISYTESVDIWALGIVIHELLFGRNFRKETIDLCTQVVETLQTYLQLYPGTIAEFLAKHMLKVKVDERSPAIVCYRAAMALPPPTDEIQRHMLAAPPPIPVPFGGNDMTSISGCSRAFSETSTATDDAKFASELSALYHLLNSSEYESTKRSADESGSDEIDPRPGKRQLFSNERQASVPRLSGARRKYAGLRLPILKE
ncbi:hypothetical protein NLG97_g7214 [Lecanicillium saksenae]|uniref:Uncharacterized protein n=1 Tax=Lecanicillium saksenae TaxID=468837 RepID=A0ACC1QMH6_9HYPO|nr:hypothetical protein NLG97_g7214 [Lecanicillium saksenae]